MTDSISARHDAALEGIAAAGREERAVTEFDVTYFGLAGLERDALMDLYADHAYKFAERHGLETPLISSRSFPTVAEWEEPGDSDTWRHKAIRRNLDMARLERERDEARAEVERLRAALGSLAANYQTRADFAPTPEAQWAAVAADVRRVLGDANEGA